jgi:hypothetical protein
MNETLIRTVLFLALSTVAATLSGCAEDPFRPLADAVLGKREAPSLSKTGAAAEKTFAKIWTSSLRSMSIRLMPTSCAFHFHTWEDEKHRQENSSLHMTDPAFKHTARPGAFYEMADLVGFNDTHGVHRVVWINMQLSKEGPTHTRATTHYCVPARDAMLNDAQFYPSTEEMIRTTMK